MPMTSSAGPRNLITDVPGILVGQAEDRGRRHRHDRGAGRSAGDRLGRCARRRARHPRDRIARRRRAGRPGRRGGAVGRLGLWPRRRRRGHGLARRGRARLCRRLGSCARRRSGCRSCRRRSCSTSLFPAGGCGRASRPIAGSAGARSRPQPRSSRSAMPGPGSAPPPGGSKAGSAAPRSCSPAAPRSARSSRSTAAARRCGPIAGASGPPNWRCPARSTRSRRSRTRPSTRGFLGMQSASVAGANTTIAVVATDAALDKGGCRRLAIMAQDGLARAIRPIHTPFDGDTVFALSTGTGATAVARDAAAARQRRGGLPGARGHARADHGRAVERGAELAPAAGGEPHGA